LPKAYKQAVELYQQAVSLDPNYALAWAGLAEACTVMEVNALVPPRSMTQQAREYAFKAIALDGSLAAPYAALGLLSAFSDRDWAAGERYFRQALASNPNYALAHAWYAGTLLAQGRFAEAEAEYLRAQELDPLHAGIANNLAETYYFWRQPERCLKQVEKVFELSPGHGWGYENQAKSYFLLGRYEEAWQAAQKTEHAQGWNAMLLARTDNVAEARRAATKLAQSESGKTSPYGMAKVYMALGDKESAFAWLQKAADRGQADLVSLKIEPDFDPLRSDPRYAALLRRVGLSP
jgi:Flp pilus assembly protein TadD